MYQVPEASDKTELFCLQNFKIALVIFTSFSLYCEIFKFPSYCSWFQCFPSNLFTKGE